ncbi:hypothetical protein BB559_002031 [Furculomyces boomerangus]|uniref:Reverse transcriptase zinc-binding domain-containing protein n=1 Tax=Furculomyces boomerangus TaxID=61424 RepID=A0A2T9YYP3_9FUNG|nr:hypothetical protein BB559_002031 [Furculomyces boomerangus]
MAISKENVFDRLCKYKIFVPEIETIHALAMWEIFRARTETGLSGTLTGTKEIKNSQISKLRKHVKDYNSKIGSAYLIKKESKPNLIPSLKEWNTAAGHEISLWLWKDVHKMKVLPKVKAFIWLLYNNGVYSAKRLNHMNSKISPNCTYCGKPENLAYVF